MTNEEWIEFSSPGCRVRVEAIKLYRRRGIIEAIRYLEQVPGTNRDTLALMKSSLIGKDHELRASG